MIGWFCGRGLIYFFTATVFLIAAFFIFRPLIAEAFFDAGNYYFGNGGYDLAKAEIFYKLSSVIDPDFLGPRYQLARIEFLRGNFPKALNYVNAELLAHPDFKRSHYVRGLINGYAGRLSEAAGDFKEFLKWDRKSWAAHNDLAWVYFTMGNYVAAEAAAREGLVLNPQNPWLLNSIGIAILNENRPEDSIGFFAEALARVREFSPDEWSRAYPGNGLAVAPEGLRAMVKRIEENYALARSRLESKK